MVNLGSSESAERTGVRTEVRFPERTSGNSHAPCRRMFRLPRFQFGVTIRNILQAPVPVRRRDPEHPRRCRHRGHGWAGARSRRDCADHRSGRKARAGLRRGLHGPRERRGKRGPGWDRHGAGRVQEDPMRARGLRAGRGCARGRESGVPPGSRGAGLGRRSWRRLRGRLRGVPGRHKGIGPRRQHRGPGPPEAGGSPGFRLRAVRPGRYRLTILRSLDDWTCFSDLGQIPAGPTRVEAVWREPVSIEGTLVGSDGTPRGGVVVRLRGGAARAARPGVWICERYASAEEIESNKDGSFRLPADPAQELVLEAGDPGGPDGYARVSYAAPPRERVVVTLQKQTQ